MCCLKCKIRIYLLIGYFLLLSASVNAQVTKIKFSRLGIGDGLSGSSVNCIYQDNKGYLWVGTSNGLNRFDGFKFNAYKHQAFKSNTLSANWVSSILQDKYYRFWVGTQGGGVNLFLPDKSLTTSFMADSTKSEDVKSNIIRTLAYDQNKTLWVGTDNGLMKMDIDELKFKQFPIDSASAKLIRYAINAIEIDKNGVLWLGTWGNGVVTYNTTSGKLQKIDIPNFNDDLRPLRIKDLKFAPDNSLWIATRGAGLIRYEPANGNYTYFTNNPKNNNSLSSNMLQSIQIESNTVVWVGTFYDGVNKINLKTNQIERFQTEALISYSISGNWIPDLFIDHSGLLWIATDKGLSKVHIKGTGFDHFTLSHNNLKTNFEANVNAIFEDSKGDIWVGTWGKGLFRYPKGNDTPVQMYDENSFDSRIWTITEFPKGFLWVGTGNGLYKIDLSNFKLTVYSNTPDQANILPANNISDLMVDHMNRLWIGTWGGGIAIYEDKSGRFLSFDSLYAVKLTDEYIKTLYSDSKMNVWIGTSNKGIVKIAPSGKVKYFKNDQGDPNTLVGDNIESIIEDNNNNIWVGTNAGGISIISEGEGNIQHLTEYNGLPSNSIRRMLFDKQNNIWISTNNGVSRFNLKTKNFKNFDITDGLQSNEYARGFVKLTNGKIMFGGINGFNKFHPDSIFINTHLPKVVITRFLKYNLEYNLDSMLNRDGILELSPSDNVISFEFSALDYYAPHKNQFLFKLEGFEEIWRKPIDDHLVTYTNLPPGDYTLRVIACNNHGLWNFEGATLKIHVKPPFYLRWYFLLIVALAVVSIIVGIVYMREYNLRRQQLELADLVRIRTQEVSMQNVLLEQKNQEILFQKVEIEKQKDEVEAQRDVATEQRDLIQRQNDELKDSIQYARRIQSALLPRFEIMHEALNDYFIFYKPRDIVSGDFYWFYKMKDAIIFAIADSTGHGVPGGFMSVLGMTLLNEIVSKQHEISAAEILNRLRTLIISALHQTNADFETKDGIDIALCIYRPKEQYIEYAGAHNPLYFMRNGELQIFQADKMPIGIYVKNTPFTNHIIRVLPGDLIYLFTDGYIDQFGELSGRKYTQARFKELIHTIWQLPLPKQYEQIELTFNQWRGAEEQVDDILVAALRIH